MENGNWTFDRCTDDDFYILTKPQVIGAKGKSSVGLTGGLTPGNTKGSVTLTTTISGTSAGEIRTIKNITANKIDYFKQ